LSLAYRHKDASGAVGEMRFEVTFVSDRGGVVTPTAGGPS